MHLEAENAAATAGAMGTQERDQEDKEEEEKFKETEHVRLGTPERFMHWEIQSGETPLHRSWKLQKRRKCVLGWGFLSRFPERVFGVGDGGGEDLATVTLRAASAKGYLVQ
ncbi:hypothetical protein CIPAW_07G062700 [Carya illinoinensis]|uniref:Uncharacterized protein n=1 Tax=Carya illinoinensis TaxID=32201 RepID=A0A8T1Q2D5_CARIL|nr:hypothetical protein CIPAW_07G062700 [Carya illinoinensis]